MSEKQKREVAKRRRKRTAGAQRLLAEVLGVSEQIIHYHKKRLGDEAPDLTDKKSWATVLAATGEESTGPPDLRRKVAEERLRLLKLSANREEIRFRLDNDEAFQAGEVKAAIRKAVPAFFFAYDRMAEVEMPPLIKGQDENGARTLLVEAGKRLKAVLMQELKKFVEE